MKKVFSKMQKHLHKYKHLATAGKVMLIGLFVGIGLYAVQNTRAQTILPLSTEMCAIYNAFDSGNRPYAASQSDMYINNDTYDIEQFPYLWYFSALANYNLGNTSSSLAYLNMILILQGEAPAFSVNDAAAILDPLITNGIMINLSPINDFTYYQGIYSVCSDTVDVPSDTSNTTYLEDSFILKNYVAGNETLIGTAANNTYVGTTKINTLDSAGEIIQPFVMKSIGETDIIEIHAPENLIVNSDINGQFPLGTIINNPIILENSVASTEFPNVLAVMELSNEDDIPMFFTQKSTNNPLDVEIVMPVTNGNIGEKVEIYYSTDDGSTRTLQGDSSIILLNSASYVRFQTYHATIFAIVGGGTGSFVINNDDATTTSANVNLDIYASGGQYMRFQNDGTGGTRSAREAYATDTAWTLSAGYGTKTVRAQFDTDGNTGTIEAETSDDIEYPSIPICGNGPGEGCIWLEISSVTGSCVYGTSVYMGATPFSTTTTGTLTTGFNNFNGDAIRYCEDSEGDSAWTLDMSSADLANGSIDTIAKENVYLQLGSAVTVYTGGACSVASDLSSSSYTAIDTTQTIFEKTATLLQTCSVGIDSLSIKVDVPPFKAIGSYTGILTLTIPAFDGISN